MLARLVECLCRRAPVSSCPFLSYVRSFCGLIRPAGSIAEHSFLGLDDIDQTARLRRERVTGTTPPAAKDLLEILTCTL
jgi:hypothetical protein